MSDCWFWLEIFDVSRNGLTTAEYVAMHGLPRELEALLASLFGSGQR